MMEETAPERPPTRRTDRARGRRRTPSDHVWADPAERPVPPLADPDARVEAFVEGAELTGVARVLRAHRDEILRRWLSAVGLQPFHRGVAERTVADHIPALFDALVALLERATPASGDVEAPLDDPAVQAAAEGHARERLDQGLRPNDVVTEFRLLRQEIGRALRRHAADLAGANRGDVAAAELLIHDALDGAIGLALAALTAYVDAAVGHFRGQLDERTREAAERERLLAALRESEERFRTLADNIAQFAWIADARGYIFWYNRRWFEYTGTTLEEVEGWGWTKVHHPAHVDRVVARIQRSWDTGEPWEDVFPLRGRDGRYRWFLSRALPIRGPDGAVVRWLGTNTDITELRQAEVRQTLLAEAGAVLAGSLDLEATLASVARLAVPGMADWTAVYLVDEDGEVRRVSAAHADPAKQALLDALLAFPVSANPDHPVRRAIATGQTVDARAVSEADASRHGTSPEHERILRGLGTNSALVVPLVARGRPVGVLSFGRTQEGEADTLDRALAVELARLAALAIDNARLYQDAQGAVRARDAVLAAVTHDLRSPLTTIFGQAQLLQRQARRASGAGVERLQAGSGMIVSSARRMTAMIDELLDVAQLRAGQRLDLQRRPTDLLELVRAVAAEQQRQTEAHRIEVEADAPEPAGLVGEWDAPRLERVLTNLVGNAVKYSPEGGEVRVAVRRGGDEAVVSVTDRGMGIPAADLPHVFEPYRRGAGVAGKIPGQGIGLASARQIVEAHGGTIHVESEEGRGSTFTVRLPLGEASADPS